MSNVFLCLIMVAVFIFGFFIAKLYFDRLLDEFRGNNRRFLKKKRGHCVSHSERFFH